VGLIHSTHSRNPPEHKLPRFPIAELEMYLPVMHLDNLPVNPHNIKQMQSHAYPCRVSIDYQREGIDGIVDCLLKKLYSSSISG